MRSSVPRPRRSVSRFLRGLDLTHAAAIPETFFTVWTNVFERGRLVGGRIDSDSWRVERHRHDRDPARARIRRACLHHGRQRREVRRLRSARRRASRSTIATPISWRPSRDATGGRGVNVVLDMVGGEYLQRNIDCLAMDGRLVQIGLLGGAKAQINTLPVLQRRLWITGSTLARAIGRGESRDRPRRSRAASGRSSKPAPSASSSTRRFRCGRPPRPTA